ncbi:MAG: hypothetical protein HDS59_08330 [Barnesiella sp.]|nr:hypothetical protein [Barnesiella sp.]
MCVIIYKPAGVKMPSIEILNAAYRANPHGCGFSSSSKTFKSLDYSKLLRQLSQVADSEPCIIHFRLATHGSVKQSNCHPFKRGGITFAHNGVLGIAPVGDKTDSETAFIKYIYPAIKRYGWDSCEVDSLINHLIGFSKFAIMYHGEVKLYGNYLLQPDGCYYSNLRFNAYLPYQYKAV